MERTPLDTVMTWKSSLERAIENATNEAEALKKATVQDLPDYIDDVIGAIADIEGNLPCDGGIQEFVDNLGGSLDDYTHDDDVALTVQGLNDTWELANRGLVTYDQLKRLITQLRDEPESHRDAILADIQTDLELHRFDIDDSMESRYESGVKFLRLWSYRQEFGKNSQYGPERGLAETTITALLNNVERGKRYLDQRFPGALADLNPLDLDLSLSYKCILGQMSRPDGPIDINGANGSRYGSYLSALTVIHPLEDENSVTQRDQRGRWAVEHGFNVESQYVPDITGYQQGVAFELLDRRWRELIHDAQHAQYLESMKETV